MKYRVDISEEQRLVIYSALSLMLIGAAHRGLSPTMRVMTEDLRENLGILPSDHAAAHHNPLYVHDLT
jgi:hypothetical protein